jgi:pSer/pThr/pTyr-binding forkhead associated (FHA) protein
MFTLTFTEPDGKRHSHPVVDEIRGLTVGRDPGCDVVLASKEVSRRHCRFFVQAGDLVVEDLGSHNGVLVSGHRIEAITVIAGSPQVELGDVFVAVGATRAPAKPPSQKGAPSSSRSSGARPATKPLNPTSTLPPGSVHAIAPRARPAARPAPRPTPSQPSVPRASAASAPAPGAGVGAGAVLRGLGPHASVQIPLPASAVVGRGEDCDVVLDDGSVSRRHAQLSRDDRGHYRLEDLGSANGTFVDGARVEVPTVLADGVKLRFGDVELLFWRPPAGAGLSQRHKMLIAVGLALAAMFAALYFLKQRHAELEVANTEQPSTGDRATQIAEQAQAALSSDRFEEAARLAQQAIDSDPIAPAPRKILAQAKREQIAQKLFADASTKAQVGREEEALQMFARLDAQSRFFPRARIKAKEVAQNLLRQHSTACKMAAARAQLETVVDVCGRALDLKCQMQDVEGDPMRKSVHQASARLGRRDSWTCPADLGPLFREEAAAAEQGGEATLVGDRALRARYPDAAIFEAVSQYARGETANALRSLTGGPAARGKTAQLSRDVAEQIRTVDGRFREGQTAVLRGELARADEIWSDALKADAALMPPGATSFMGQQMRTTLGQAHAKIGDERLAKAQYSSAYDEYMKGLALQPADAHLLDSLARLEKVAEGLLAGGSCDQIQTASRITRADPPSPAHAQAQKALEACGGQQ